CPNLPDNQTVIPEGYEKVGESNDCTQIPSIITTDDDDDNGGGGGGGTRVKKQGTPTVLGASTSQCGMYLFDFMRQGIPNDEWEVKKLQWFLIGQGYFITATGIFDAATDDAVRKFQLKYQSEVLTPWFVIGFVPHNNPTGWVYQLTRWKINNIVCPGSEALPTLIP
ncbi:MAG: peptidoglycan-binding domain-containing protein, partial [Patescibacteria group bacterium]